MVTASSASNRLRWEGSPRQISDLGPSACLRSASGNRSSWRQIAQQPATSSRRRISDSPIAATRPPSRSASRGAAARRRSASERRQQLRGSRAGAGARHPLDERREGEQQPGPAQAGLTSARRARAQAASRRRRPSARPSARCLDLLAPLEIGDRAGEAEYPVVGAPAETLRLVRPRQQPRRLAAEVGRPRLRRGSSPHCSAPRRGARAGAGAPPPPAGGHRPSAPPPHRRSRLGPAGRAR